MNAWNQSPVFADTTTPDISQSCTQGACVYLRIRKDAGNQYYAAATTGDRILPPAMAEVSGILPVFTPAYIGFGRIYAATNRFSQVALDWFRVSTP